MQIALGNSLRQHQSIVLATPGFAKLLKLIGSQHLAEGIGCIDRAIDQNVGDMNSLWRKFCVECLRQHSAPTHGGGVGMLTGIASH